MTQPAYITRGALPGCPVRPAQSWWACRYRRLLTDPAELDARLAKGEQEACRRADRTLARTMLAMGL